MTFRLALTGDALRELAEANGVCVRPIVHEVYDSETGHTHLVPTPCGATRATKCAPCAQKNRLLRMQQCREGWHLEEEPEVAPSATENEDDEAGDDSPEDDDPEPEDKKRRARSTRRRQDTPDLPRLPVEDRTIGKAFTAPSGRTYRPSMFATFTLPSYGRVHADGTPVDPSRYNYRRAALDALHFAKLIDRLWQNLRRAVGFKVQYFAAVEPQRIWHRICTLRSAGRSLARSSVRWWPPPTTRCGGPRARSRCTSSSSPSGPTSRGTSTRPPESHCRRGRRPWTRSTRMTPHGPCT
jgi:hypothetical protein